MALASAANMQFVTKPAVQFLRRHWPREQESLRQRAAQRLQDLGLALVFDAFRHHNQAEVAHQMQAGVGLLHDHVVQDDCNFALVLEHFTGLGGRIGMYKFQLPMFHLKIAQSERGGRMDVLVVVDVIVLEIIQGRS